MTLEQIINQVKACAQQMDARYGQIVFDEWAIVSLAENRARVLFYSGPRNDAFLRDFVKDLGALRAELLTENTARAILNLPGTAPAPALNPSWSWGAGCI